MKRNSYEANICFLLIELCWYIFLFIWRRSESIQLSKNICQIHLGKDIWGWMIFIWFSNFCELCLNWNIFLIVNCYLQYPVFSIGPPSKQWSGSTVLNFGDRTSYSVVSVIWALTSNIEHREFSTNLMLGPRVWVGVSWPQIQ